MDTDTFLKSDIRNLDLKSLALKPEFGELKFEKSYKDLEKIKSWLIELDDFNFKEELPQSAINEIENYIRQFNEHIQWLQSFNIKTTRDPGPEHDNFEARIQDYYNNFFKQIVPYINFLRQEAELNDEDKKKRRDELKELSQLREQSKELVTQLEQERQKIQAEKQKIETAKGERAAVRFGKHFESQAEGYTIEAQKWLNLRNIFFWLLLILIFLNVLGYFVLFFNSKFYNGPIAPKDLFSLEYGLAKLALLSILSYAIAFSSRNYNINSNLSTLNTHRKNVAETLNDFLETNPEENDRSKIVESATDAMFRHQPIGYLPKIESKDDGPIASTINNILRQN